MNRLALFLALTGIPALAQDVTLDGEGSGATCVWSRVSPRGAYDGPCEVQPDSGGLRVTAGLRDFLIRDRKSVGDWGLVSLNGLEAMRHDIDPSHSSYATTDLNEVLGIVR